MAARKGKSSANVQDLTIEVLTSIRDEVRNLRDDVRGTNARLDQTNERLDGMNDRLDRTNERLDLHEQALKKLIVEVHSLNDRFDNFLTGAHRKEHDELRARVERLEQRLDEAGE